MLTDNGKKGYKYKLGSHTDFHAKTNHKQIALRKASTLLQNEKVQTSLRLFSVISLAMVDYPGGVLVAEDR